MAEQIGSLMEFWGFKRALGRVWTVLFLSEQPLTAAQIGERLGLSPSAVSVTLADLKRWGVVHEDVTLHTRTRRAQLWRPERDIWGMVNNVFRQRELPMVRRTEDVIRAAQAQLERLPQSPEVKQVRTGLRTLSAIATAGRTMLETLLATGRASTEALRKLGLG